MPITIHHPKTGNVESWRIGDYKFILGSPVGTVGLPEADVVTALRHWEPDQHSYNKMDFVLPDSMMFAFIIHDENPDDFIPIVIGKERKSTYAKAALQNIVTGKIVFRSATFSDEPCRKRLESHDPEWSVEIGLFNADKSFWREMKRSFRSHPLLD
jgi:hypothetical protein